MKQDQFSKCAQCGKGMAEGSVHFYRVMVEQMVLDLGAIRRQHGLEMMMGNAAIARALSPDEDMAHRIAGGAVLVCGTCGCSEGWPVHQLMETATQGDEEKSDG